MIPLIVAAVLALTVLVGFVALVVSIHRNDRAMSRGGQLRDGLARRVTGCYVSRGVSWT
ncbi:hypothetical protein HNP84_008515 [Thermocatellispora tengchongensis]|uniref:Uncharacterized protein n=1 Tax=Thermocatellispora tengchongensis TaxID=1073253 RepID=A0A840PNW6_9ACTN|nr:hypothetical protein [Thermocatellispora tengchongensis]MBB5138757.1 hypothetical protein [Thermocatellispora tengchongensis]